MSGAGRRHAPVASGPDGDPAAGRRTDGAAAVIGQTYLYAGGSDGKAAVATTYVSHAVGTGNLDKWSEGPALPEARSDAAYLAFGDTLYLFGGYGPDGAPTTTAYSLTVGSDGTVGEWKADAALALPEPRAGGSVVTVSDGVVVMGGTDGTAPTRSVWKSQLISLGRARAPGWRQAAAVRGERSGVAVHVGDIIFARRRPELERPGDDGPAGHRGWRRPRPPPRRTPNVIDALARSATTDEPARSRGRTCPASPRTAAIYVDGGHDASGPKRTETVVAPPTPTAPSPRGTTCPARSRRGLEGSSVACRLVRVILVGGRPPAGPTSTSRAPTWRPQEPFFQLGVLGATIPGLKLDGGSASRSAISTRRASARSTSSALLLDRLGVRPPAEGPRDPGDAVGAAPGVAARSRRSAGRGSAAGPRAGPGAGLARSRRTHRRCPSRPVFAPRPRRAPRPSPVPAPKLCLPRLGARSEGSGVTPPPRIRWLAAAPYVVRMQRGVADPGCRLDRFRWSLSVER